MINNPPLVAYYGRDCGLCAQCCRIPQRALSLQDAMRLAGYELVK